MNQGKHSQIAEQIKKRVVVLGLPEDITYDQLRDWLFETHGWFVNINDKRKIHPITDSLQENSGFIAHVTNKNGVVVVGSGGMHFDTPDKALRMAIETAIVTLTMKNK